MWLRLDFSYLRERKIKKVIENTEVPWQSVAEYLSGVCIALLFAAPLLLRLSMAGLWTNVLLILVGAVFTVSMAFFLGFWTK